MCHDCIDHNLVDSLAIVVNFRDSGPKHVILVHIIPKHFIHPNLKYALKVGIDGFLKDSSDPQLVDIKARSVAIVEYLWMP